jgi:hypothetical protein
MLKSVCSLTALTVVALTGAAVHAAEQPSFLRVVQGYADAMIEKGRDTYGPQKSLLFLSAFDRHAMKPLTTRPASPGGVRRGDRSGPAWTHLTGANPQLDQNLLRILYTLTEITGDRKYADAADHEIRWFFENTPSPVTNLFPWGEHLSWETTKDGVVSGGDEYMHEFARPWTLWDRCWELAPEPCKKFALGLWEHQIANHKTGGFDRHAPYFEHGPVDGKDFARHAGFYIQTWGYAFKHTKDPVFLQAIEVLLGRFEKQRASIGPLDTHTASTMVPDPLSKRLSDFALKEDEAMTASFKGTFGKAAKDFKPTWQAGYSSGVLASGAMYYLGRYEQVPNPAYRDYIIAVADAYIDQRPAEDADVWAMSFGHIISAQVAAYRFTKKKLYLDQANRIARLAVDVLWQDNPLPRASTRTGHYESICGPDTLALALLEVHAAQNDLSVAIPSNTIDR